jgi:hypothetical protein
MQMQYPNVVVYPPDDPLTKRAVKGSIIRATQQRVTHRCTDSVDSLGAPVRFPLLNPSACAFGKLAH